MGLLHLDGISVLDRVLPSGTVLRDLDPDGRWECERVLRVGATVVRLTVSRKTASPSLTTENAKQLR